MKKERDPVQHTLYQSGWVKKEREDGREGARGRSKGGREGGKKGGREGRRERRREGEGGEGGRIYVLYTYLFVLHGVFIIKLALNFKMCM